MAKFSYIAKDLEGKTYHNVAEAENRAELIKNLQAQKYFIVSVEEVMVAGRGGASRPLPSIGPRKFNHRGIRLVDKLVFARQMATMLGAGVNLSRTLNVLLQQIDSENLFKVVRKVQRDVENGVSLSMAMSQHPKAFDQFWVSLVEVGEASGTMPTVLTKLSNHLERQASFQTAIISGFIYPTILICICMGAILFFALVVGPKFQEDFASMKIKLPILTLALLALFDFIKRNLFLLIFVTGGSIVGLVSFVRNTYGGRKMFEGFVLGLPVLGNVCRYALVEKFTSQMALLIESGVPILYALDITERLVNNHTCAEVINRIKEGVKKGDNLTTPMGQSGFFPPMAVQMIIVGEETGQLNQMMGFVAKYYEDLVSTFMKRFSTIIEPVIILVMGGMVGVVVVAMFLPLVNMAKLGG